MGQALLDKPVQWLAGDGPESSVVVATECSLLRNLADHPFPARCSVDERRSVEERMVNVFDAAGLLSTGRYWPLSTSFLPPDAAGDAWLGDRRMLERLLAERRLVSLFSLQSKGMMERIRVEAPEGVYVADDQSMSIMVNGIDHVCLRGLASGMQLLEVWARLNLVDDTLAGSLLFAFDDRYGYLTSDLGHAGTGLSASVILHLPGLAMRGQLGEVAQLAVERRHRLCGLKPEVSSGGLTKEFALPDSLYGDWYGAQGASIAQAEGDLFLLSNVSTLGVSEEEILYHLRHLTSECVAREHAARAALTQENRAHLEDRVARAVGLASHVRLLDFSEALSLVSSLRLGVDMGLAGACPLRQLNELLITSQQVHLQVRMGRDCDDLALRAKRADLFRGQLSQN